MVHALRGNLTPQAVCIHNDGIGVNFAMEESGQRSHPGGGQHNELGDWSDGGGTQEGHVVPEGLAGAAQFVWVECDQGWVMGLRVKRRAFVDHSVPVDEFYHQHLRTSRGIWRQRITAVTRDRLPSLPYSSAIWPACIFLLFFLNKALPVCGACEDFRCATDFSRILDSGKVLVGSNLPYCFLLEQYDQCLRGTSRSCRGNLRFHSITTMVASHRKEHKCVALLERHRKVVGSTSDQPGEDQSEVSSGRCLYPYHHQRGASGYRYCSVFGDPHIRTLNGQHETCLTLGAWPLLDNSYFAVQVTNRPVGDVAGASCISKITIVVKSLTGCTEQKMYEATREFLPSSFVDGTTTSDEPMPTVNGAEYAGSKESASQGIWMHQFGASPVGTGHRPAVMIREIIPKAHIEIYIRYISTRITIRLVEGYLLFSVKIPEEIVAQKSTENTLQLCLTGCPASERVEYKEVLADPDYFLSSIGVKQVAMNRAEAELLCREAGASDFFFDSCVFDLLVTGDEQFKMSSVLALRDIRQLYPPYVRNYEMNRTNLQPYDMLATIERSKELMTVIGARRTKSRSFSSSVGSSAFSVDGPSALALLLVASALFLRLMS